MNKKRIIDSKEVGYFTEKLLRLLTRQVERFSNRYILLLILSGFSLFVLWPRNQNTVSFSRIESSPQSVVFPFALPTLASSLQLMGIPLVIKFNTYDLRISNLNKEYDISYVLTFDENDPMLQYFEKSLGSPTPSIDGHPGFEVTAGASLLIREIPANIKPKEMFGPYLSCGLNDLVSSRCPSGLELFSQLIKKNIKASPNIDPISLFVQIIVILGFWIVVINNTFEFFRIKKY